MEARQPAQPAEPPANTLLLSIPIRLAPVRSNLLSNT